MTKLSDEEIYQTHHSLHLAFENCILEFPTKLNCLNKLFFKLLGFKEGEDICGSKRKKGNN